MNIHLIMNILSIINKLIIKLIINDIKQFKTKELTAILNEEAISFVW